MLKVPGASSRFVWYVVAVIIYCLRSNIAQAEMIATDLKVWATDQGQHSTSAYMVLNASEDIHIVGVSTPVAKSAAFFQVFYLSGSVRMRMVEKLALPSGKTVDFANDGYQLILSGLKSRIDVGQTIPVTLHIVDRTNRPSTLQLTLTAEPFPR
jgi:copper(I)-binding protein